MLKSVWPNTKVKIHNCHAPLSYPGTPSKGNQGKSPISSHRFSDLCSTTDSRADSWVDRVSGKHLLNNLSDGHGHQGSRGSSLPESTVAADQAEAVVPAKHRHGKVESCDDADNTQWVPLLQ